MRFIARLFCDSAHSFMAGLAFVLVLFSELNTSAQVGYQVQGASPDARSSIPSAYSQRATFPATANAKGGYPSYTAQAEKGAPQSQSQQSYSSQPMPSQYALIGMSKQSIKPSPYPETGSIQASVKPNNFSYAADIETLKRNDRAQDLRLAQLEGRTHGGSLAPTASPAGYVRHRVELGETLSSIAASHNLSVEELKLMNSRKSNIVLTGETLNVPARRGQGTYRPSLPSKEHGDSQPKQGGIHIVRSGESLTQIASAYHVSSKSLQSANGIRNPNLITQGQRLKIPGSAASLVATSKSVIKAKPTPKRDTEAKPKAATPQETVVVASTPTPVVGSGMILAPSMVGSRGVTSYRIESGDHIDEVARNFSTTPADIQRMNKLASATLPPVGEEIFVPLPGSVSL